MRTHCVNMHGCTSTTSLLIFKVHMMSVAAALVEALFTQRKSCTFVKPRRAHKVSLTLREFMKISSGFLLLYLSGNLIYNL